MLGRAAAQPQATATTAREAPQSCVFCALCFGTRLADEPILTTEELQSLEAAETLCSS